MDSTLQVSFSNSAATNNTSNAAVKLKVTPEGKLHVVESTEVLGVASISNNQHLQDNQQFFTTRITDGKWNLVMSPTSDTSRLFLVPDGNQHFNVASGIGHMEPPAPLMVPTFVQPAAWTSVGNTFSSSGIINGGTISSVSSAPIVFCSTANVGTMSSPSITSNPYSQGQIVVPMAHLRSIQPSLSSVSSSSSVNAVTLPKTINTIPASIISTPKPIVGSSAKNGSTDVGVKTKKLRPVFLHTSPDIGTLKPLVPNKDGKVVASSAGILSVDSNRNGTRLALASSGSKSAVVYVNADALAEAQKLSTDFSCGGVSSSQRGIPVSVPLSALQSCSEKASPIIYPTVTTATTTSTTVSLTNASTGKTLNHLVVNHDNSQAEMCQTSVTGKTSQNVMKRMLAETTPSNGQLQMMPSVVGGLSVSASTFTIHHSGAATEMTASQRLAARLKQNGTTDDKGIKTSDNSGQITALTEIQNTDSLNEPVQKAAKNGSDKRSNQKSRKRKSIVNVSTDDSEGNDTDTEKDSPELTLKIDSVYSLSDDVTVLNKSGDKSASSMESADSESAKPVKSDFRLPRCVWEINDMFGSPFVVLERLSNRDMAFLCRKFRNARVKSKCSNYCRQKTLDYLCKLKLINCRPIQMPLPNSTLSTESEINSCNTTLKKFKKSKLHYWNALQENESDNISKKNLMSLESNACSDAAAKSSKNLSVRVTEEVKKQHDLAKKPNHTFVVPILPKGSNCQLIPVSSPSTVYQPAPFSQLTTIMPSTVTSKISTPLSAPRMMVSTINQMPAPIFTPYMSASLPGPSMVNTVPTTSLKQTLRDSLSQAIASSLSKKAVTPQLIHSSALESSGLKNPTIAPNPAVATFPLPSVRTRPLVKTANSSAPVLQVPVASNSGSFMVQVSKGGGSGAIVNKATFSNGKITISGPGAAGKQFFLVQVGERKLLVPATAITTSSTSGVTLTTSASTPRVGITAPLTSPVTRVCLASRGKPPDLSKGKPADIKSVRPNQAWSGPRTVAGAENQVQNIMFNTSSGDMSQIGIRMPSPGTGVVSGIRPIQLVSTAGSKPSLIRASTSLLNPKTPIFIQPRLPLRLEKRVSTMTEEERLAKRARLEKKYPLPPGVRIKTEPESSGYGDEIIPPVITTTTSSLRIVVPRNHSTTLSTPHNKTASSLCVEVPRLLTIRSNSTQSTRDIVASVPSKSSRPPVISVMVPASVSMSETCPSAISQNVPVSTSNSAIPPPRPSLNSVVQPIISISSSNSDLVQTLPVQASPSSSSPLNTTPLIETNSEVWVSTAEPVPLSTSSPLNSTSLIIAAPEVVVSAVAPVPVSAPSSVNSTSLILAAPEVLVSTAAPDPVSTSSSLNFAPLILAGPKESVSLETPVPVITSASSLVSSEALASVASTQVTPTSLSSSGSVPSVIPSFCPSPMASLGAMWLRKAAESPSDLPPVQTTLLQSDRAKRLKETLAKLENLEDVQRQRALQVLQKQFFGNA